MSTVFSEEVEIDIVAALAAGSNYDTAARYAGISPRTLDNWIRRGKDDEAVLEEHDDAEETRMLTFYRRVKKAEANAELAALSRIRQAGVNGIWTADAWFLERRHGYIRKEPQWEPDDLKVGGA